MILGVIGATIFSNFVDLGQVVDSSMAAQGQSAPPEARDFAIRITGIMIWIGAILGTPIMMLIVGAALLVGAKILKGKVDFGVCMAIVGYSLLAMSVVSALMIWPALIAVGDSVYVENPAPTNAAFFIDPVETPRPLYLLIRSIDLLALYCIALMALGMKRVTGKSFYAYAAYTLGLYFAWNLVTAGLAALGGAAGSSGGGGM
jgi:hypothetical protein